MKLPINFCGCFVQTELAWAAGFFDGEGYTGFGGKNITVSIAQATSDDTVPEVLKRFQNLFGAGSVALRFKEGQYGARKAQYGYYVSSFEAVQFITSAMWKYLSKPKKDQIAKAFILYKNRAGTRPYYGGRIIKQSKIEYSVIPIDLKDLGLL